MFRYFSTPLIQLFSLLFFFITACSDKQKKNEAVSTDVIEKEGILYNKNSGKPYTGKIKAKVYGKKMEYGVKDGMKDGEFKIYFENGKLEMIGWIVNNKNEGHWKYFFRSGALESEGDFINDLADDKWTWYHENGKLKEEGYFKNGKREGRWTSFDSLGNISEEAFFRNGKEIKREK